MSYVFSIQCCIVHLANSNSHLSPVEYLYAMLLGWVLLVRRSRMKQQGGSTTERATQQPAVLAAEQLGRPVLPRKTGTKWDNANSRRPGYSASCNRVIGGRMLLFLLRRRTTRSAAARQSQQGSNNKQQPNSSRDEQPGRDAKGHQYR